MLDDGHSKPTRPVILLSLNKDEPMKNLIILGAGTAGTMMANKLYRVLNKDVWNIIIIDRDEMHYYQPGFLFIPFGVYKPEEVVKPKINFLPKEVDFFVDQIKRIKPEE